MIQQGDTVTEDQMVMEVETDKAAVELPVPYAGVVTQLNVEAGATVSVGDVLLVVDAAGAAAEKPAETKAAEPELKAASAPAQSVRHEQTASQAVGGDGRVATSRTATITEPPPHATGPIPAAPAIRRYAREQGIDLRQVHGTGPGGRIVREDVERYAIAGPTGSGVAPSPATPAQPAPATPGQPIPATPGQPIPATPAQPIPAMPSEPLPDFSQWGPVRREKVAQIRKTIARQMVKSWTIPRVTHGDEADITDLEAFRKEHGAVMIEQGVKLTLTAFILKAVAGALRQFPQFNSSYDEAAGDIIYKDYVHVGVAVDTPKGLMVPVVRDADRKGLMTISKELKEVADRAREFKLDISEMRGGTFTLTNVGALGGTFATPMINSPEVAILGMGKLIRKPMVKGEDEIVIRKMLPLFLSFDHRVIDGADGARFTSTIISFLENPLNLLLAS
ncbi:MAG: 2-oxo acid dehydrogenase subunit E2 [Phycisphaerales bacterium]|nr:2-oxo acid dehydrogenase subunit E2 [Phycisphaerales bacterium]